VKASFVPPAPVRELRDLTRTRTVITRERTREVQRLEKLLEDTGIKLSSVASDIIGVSGRAMLEALIAGQRDPAVLAELSRGRMRQKIGALTEALTGRFNTHHAFMTRLFLDRIDAHSADIARLDARIEEAMAPFLPARDLLISIPGFSRITAEVFVAETGADMSVFPTAGHLASWAGLSPGSNESAGRVKSTKTRPGNRYLKGVLGAAALTAARSRNTYFSAKYKRIATRRGPMRAIVAVEHAMVIAAFNLLTNGDFYRDPGPNYYTQRQPARTRARAISQLETLGYRVTLEPLTNTAQLTTEPSRPLWSPYFRVSEAPAPIPSNCRHRLPRPIVDAAARECRRVCRHCADAGRARPVPRPPPHRRHPPVQSTSICHA
jgi:transposase